MVHNDWRSISERIACTYGGRCTWLSGNHAVEVLDGPTKPICEGHCLLIPSRRTQLRTLSYAAVEVVGDWRGDPHIEIVSFPRRRAGEKSFGLSMARVRFLCTLSIRRRRNARQQLSESARRPECSQRAARFALGLPGHLRQKLGRCRVRRRFLTVPADLSHHLVNRFARVRTTNSSKNASRLNGPSRHRNPSFQRSCQCRRFDESTSRHALAASTQR